MGLDSAGGAVAHTRLGLSSEVSCSSVSQCLLVCGAFRVKTLPSPARSAATAPWSASPSSGSAGHRWTASCPSGWDRTLRGHFELCLQIHRSLPGSDGSADSWCTVLGMRKHEIRQSRVTEQLKRYSRIGIVVLCWNILQSWSKCQSDFHVAKKLS